MTTEQAIKKLKEITRKRNAGFFDTVILGNKENDEYWKKFINEEYAQKKNLHKHFY